jgi:hypothetical protein
MLMVLTTLLQHGTVKVSKLPFCQGRWYPEGFPQKKKTKSTRTRTAAFDNQLVRVNFAWVDSVKCVPLRYSCWLWQG